ncbi:hypothetical protein KO465_05115 [Candidatus Micrarchaeota archaeon]|nr:hypothetical protein [Candidatus Micrarchaeota archaeon]
MNRAIVYDNLTLLFGGHPIQFKIGLGFEGNLKNCRVKGLDLNEVRKKLETCNLRIRSKRVKDIFENYTGMESLAEYYLSEFPESDFVRVIEHDTEEVWIYRN